MDRYSLEQNSSLPYVYYGQPVCTTCGDIGHQANSPGGCSTPVCSSCGTRGHAANECSAACSTCGRVHKFKAPGGACPYDVCLICNMYGHTSPKCPIQQCRTCGCRGHSSTDCRACHLCAQHGHAASCCPSRGLGAGQQASHSSSGAVDTGPIPAVTAAVTASTPPFSVHLSSSNGSSWPSSFHADAQDFRAVAAAAWPHSGAAGIPALAVFSVGLLRLTLQPPAASQDEENSRRQALMETLLMRAEAYAVSLLADGQEQKFAALSRLSEADLEKVLLEPSPEMVLDKFWEQYQQQLHQYQPEQQQQRQQYAMQAQQQQYGVLAYADQHLQHLMHGAQHQQNQHQQQSYMSLPQAVPHHHHQQQLQQQQQPVQAYWQQLPEQGNQQQSQQPTDAPHQHQPHAVPPCDLPPEIAAEFEHWLSANILPPDWRCCTSWGQLLARVNMLASGTDKEAVQQTKQKVQQAMLHVQAAAAAALQHRQQLQLQPVALQYAEGWDSTAQSTHQQQQHTALQHTSVDGRGSTEADASTATQQAEVDPFESRARESPAWQPPASSGWESSAASSSPSALKSAVQPASTTVSYSAAVTAAPSSSRQFSPANIPLRKPCAQVSVWQQQLINLLLPVAEGYAAALLQDEQKMSCLCRVMPEDLAIVLRMPNPTQFLDQTYEHYVKTNQGSAKRQQTRQQQQAHLQKLLTQLQRHQLCRLGPCDIIPDAAEQFEAAQPGRLPGDWRTFTNWSCLELATSFGVEWYEGKAAFREAQLAARIATANALATAEHEQQSVKFLFMQHLTRLTQQQAQLKAYRSGFAGLTGRFILPCDLLPQHAEELERALPPGALPAGWQEFGSWRHVEGDKQYNIARDGPAKAAYIAARNQACDATVAALQRAPQEPLGQQAEQSLSTSKQQQQQEMADGETSSSSKQQQLNLGSSGSKPQHQHHNDLVITIRPYDLPPKLAKDFEEAMNVAGVLLPPDWHEYEGFGVLEESLQLRAASLKAAFSRARADADAGTLAILAAGQHPDKKLSQTYERAVLYAQAPSIGPSELSSELAASFEAAAPAELLPSDWRSYASWRRLDDACAARAPTRRQNGNRLLIHYRNARNNVRTAAAKEYLQQKHEQQQQQDGMAPEQRQNWDSSSSSNGGGDGGGSRADVGRNHVQQQAKVLGPTDLTPEAADAFEAALCKGMLPADWRQYAKWGQLELHMKFTVSGETPEAVQNSRKQYKVAVQQAQEATAAAVQAAVDANLHVAGAESAGAERKRSSSGALHAEAPAFVPAATSSGSAKGSQPVSAVNGGSSSSVSGVMSSSARCSSGDGSGATSARVGGGGSQRSSSNGLGTGSQADPDPLYVPAGHPVCSRCGDEGHRRGACRTPYCDSCEAYGHLEGPDCVWACWKCGRHHKGLPAGAQCPNYKCFGCSLFGHQVILCPSVQCMHCKLYGHKRAECKACQECGQYGHKAKDCPGFCTRCKTAGHKTAACRVVQCAQCGQLGHVLGAAECPAQAGNTSNTAGKGKGKPSKPAYDIKKLRLQPVACSQEAEARRDSFMNVLLANSTIEHYAIKLIDEPEKLVLLSQLGLSDLQQVLQQPKPDQLLDQLYAFLEDTQRQTQTDSCSASGEQQQQQQQQPAQGKALDAVSNRSGKHIVLPCDLPDHLAERFEANMLPGSLPSKWRTYRSWKQLETEFAEYVKSTGDWIGERRVEFRQQRLDVQLKAAQEKLAEKRRQQGWSNIGPPPPPPPSQQQQKQEQAQQLQQLNALERWPEAQQQQGAAQGWPAFQSTAAEQKQEASVESWPSPQDAAVQEQQDDDSWAAGDGWVPEQQQPQHEQNVSAGLQQPGSNGALPDNRQHMAPAGAGAMPRGAPCGVAAAHMQPPHLPAQPHNLQQHVLHLHAQPQSHLVTGQQGARQQQPPKPGPSQLSPNAAAAFVQSLPAGMLPHTWQQFTGWGGLQKNVNFAVGGAEKVHEHVSRFNQAMQVAQHNTMMEFKAYMEASQQQQQHAAAMVQPAAAYTQAPPITVSIHDLPGHSVHASGRTMHAGLQGWQHGGAAASTVRHAAGDIGNADAQQQGRAGRDGGNDDEDLGEMLGLLGV